MSEVYQSESYSYLGGQKLLPDEKKSLEGIVFWMDKSPSIPDDLKQDSQEIRYVVDNLAYCNDCSSGSCVSCSSSCSGGPCGNCAAD